VGLEIEGFVCFGFGAEDSALWFVVAHGLIEMMCYALF
jgi:hypothetical protein